jgi:HK97 family phage prohead protease/HK97 family phage major capsid protein
MFEYMERKLAPLPDAASSAEFILSDGEPDRMGDIIDPEGWQISKFSPIALFNHSRGDIIGKWEKVRVEAKALRGALKLAEPGTSPIVDMARALVDQGLLDTVSVGFRPIEREPVDPKDPFGPQRFRKAELIEASLVSIPANPRARRIAKQFLPEDQYRRLCAASGATRDGDGEPKSVAITRSQPGKSAESKSNPPKVKSMEGLSPQPIGKKIEVTEQTLVTLKDQLTDLGNKIAQVESPTDEQQTEVEALAAEIDAKEKSLASLKSVEARLKTKAVQVAPPKSNIAAFPGFERKALQPRDYYYKAVTAAVMAQLWKSRGRMVAAEDMVKEHYGNDEAMQLVLKAATNPANTTVAGWAQELVGTVMADFMAALPVSSIYPGLSALGQRYTFGRAGIIKIPLRNTVALGSAGALNGSFVAEGSPIPVRRASLGSISLTPKKMAVISSFTREMDLHSTPSIETVVRQAMNEDTARAIDAALVGTTAADTVRPAGLQAAANSPVSVAVSTATASYDKMVADLKGLISAIVNNGGGETLVLLINPADALSLQWVTIADGSFPFDSVQNGNLRGLRVLQSSTVTVKQPIMVDANEFASVTSDSPEFDVSDQATIHEEDTTPLQIATGAQGSGVLATPTRSLWQTYSAAIRMILPMNWAMRRTGMVSFMAGPITW